MFKSGSKKILATLLSTAICATILVQTVCKYNGYNNTS